MTIVGCTAPPALLQTTETPQELAVRKQEERAVRDRLGRVGSRNDPKKSDKLEKMTFAKKAKRFRSVAKEGPQDDLNYLVGFRNTLAHGKLIYEPQTGQLKIYNRKHSEWVVLTEALRAEIDEKVIRVDEVLNGLLVEQKPPERS